MAKRSTFVGLDVHIESIAVALAESSWFWGGPGLRDGRGHQSDRQGPSRCARLPDPTFPWTRPGHVDSQCVDI